MGLAEKDGLVASLNSGASFGAEKAAAIYNGFNSIWRPAVLLRLGYTQRNFAEGVVRSSAFVGSLAPLGYAGKQVGFGFRNAVVSRSVEREAKKLKAFCLVVKRLLVLRELSFRSGVTLRKTC